ncbi:Oxysterol binding protein [Apophysomyces sp. BC1015]|nr:Oxysterol binding protein [Apophysomyces sp. BC1015]KAG0175591.1 Oxysterol binding protein [Apophysomyces sp. BC1021]
MGRFFPSNKTSSAGVDVDRVPTANDVDKLSLKSESGTGGQFKEFLKTVISFTGDLSSLTCPAFFLNGLSLLEYGTYWGDHPTCFTAVSDPSNPQERMLAVTRWFMSTLWGSYASRCTNGLTEKKPFNPILGEQFHCTLGDVKCVCEQVRHHPPISAFYLENEKAGVSLNGHCGQKSRFKGTAIKIEQVGRATLYLKNCDEQYVIDFPDLFIRGVLTGSCYLELSGICTIACTNGAKSVVEFVPKPWFSGEYNHIKGSIVYGGTKYYALFGRWSHRSYFSSANGSSAGEPQLLFDAEAESTARRMTPPCDDQQEIESHRLWSKVSEALERKDYHIATAEKSKIEEWQRKLRRERAEKNEDWIPSLFSFQLDKDAGDVYSQNNVQLLKAMVGNPFLDDGAWTFNNALHKR